MTTSSSEATRAGHCTRISPSAILDDRLSGVDLDWARDHLRRCDTCRERVDDFQEMRLRLERLPQAQVSAEAIEDAFAIVVPDAPRPVPSQARLVGAPVPTPPASLDKPAPTAYESATPRSDVASVPDLLSDLEHEIFRDAPWGEHPAGLMPGSLPGSGAFAGGLGGAVDEAPARPSTEPADLERKPPAYPFPLREVPVESGPPAPVMRPASRWGRTPDDATSLVPPADEPAAEEAAAETHGAAWSTQEFDAERAPETPSAARDTAIRLAVGLGAAACVLLAALLYQTGWFHVGQGLASASPRPSVVATISQRPTSAPTVAATATPVPTPTPLPVLATLGSGVTGESVFRIRPGTAVPTWTRLVFDLTGSGLPTMMIARPDSLHIQVTFVGTGGANVPVGGLHSRQVSGVEPAVQQGADLVITIDLVAPVRLVDFTLPPASGYAPRLVLDLHTD